MLFEHVKMALVGTAVDTNNQCLTLSFLDTRQWASKSKKLLLFLAPRHYRLSLIRAPNRGPASVHNILKGVGCTKKTLDNQG